MPSIGHRSCVDDCNCLLCRELGSYKMATNLEVPQGSPSHLNFILRRGLPFATRTPSKEWLEAEDSDYVGCEDVTLEKKSREPEMERTMTPVGASNGRKTERDIAHKTVIYFGDSNQRQKENKVCSKELSSREMSSQSKEESRMSKAKREDGSGDEKRFEKGQVERQRSTVSLMGNEEAKVTHEIVVNVSPSREDVLRIEEDESQLEDYWSLPGDNTGFKVDWSFVQQWRLRG